MVLVTGNVEERKGVTQFIVQKLVPVEMIKKRASRKMKSLYVKIPAKLQVPEVLNELHSILKRYPGHTKVILYYEKENRMIKLGDENCVDPEGKCLKEISGLLGAECVKLK